MIIKNIGSPNSIARYAANTTWGSNDFATFEYVQGMPVVRAAGSQRHCEHYMAPGRVVVDIRPYKDSNPILHGNQTCETDVGV